MTEFDDIEETLPLDPEQTLASAESEPFRLPKELAGYEILGELGRGGMGVVYKARQENPDRFVALKVIRADLATEEMLARFQMETDALGRLQHPGIARIYEAGTAMVDGHPQPYFAMEYVEGRPLLAWKAEAEPDNRKILDTVLALCDAVQHAHQRGIIHRDLKPDNILMDAAGRPRILDFGLARTTDTDVTMAQAQTLAGQVLGTLPYMSPEQATGDQSAIDTRCDIYAMGVITYQLLAGRLPIDLQDRLLHEAVRIIQEAEPHRLSTINRSWRGDLDTIISKALEKDRERRYDSVSAYADDLARYLNDEPISARPPSAWYQASKFARRNRLLVVGVAGIFLASLVGVVGTSFGLVRAEKARAGEQEQRIEAESARAGEQAQRIKAEQAMEEANRFYGGALFESALRSFDGGQPQPGKVLMARAAELTPTVDPRLVQMHNAIQLEFPMRTFVGADGTPIGSTPVAFSGDGRFLFYVRAGLIHRYEFATEQHVALPKLSSPPMRIVASPSGRLVAACDNVGSLALLDADARTVLQERSFRPKTGSIGATYVLMSFHPKETDLAIYYEYGKTHEIRILSTEDLSQIAESTLIEQERNHRAYGLRYGAHGDMLSLGLGGEALWVFRRDLKTVLHRTNPNRAGRAASKVDRHTGKWRSYSAVGQDGRIYGYLGHERKRIWSTAVVARIFTCMEFVSDGNFIVYGGRKGEGGILDAADGRIVHRFPMGGHMAASAAASLAIADGVLIDLSRLDSQRTMIDDRAALSAFKRGIPSTAKALIEAVKGAGVENPTSVGGVSMYAASRDGTKECYRHDSGQYFVLDHDTGAFRRYTTPWPWCFFMSFSEQDRSIVAIGGRPGKRICAEVLNLESGKIHRKDVPFQQVSELRVAALHSGEYMILSDARNALWLYDIPGLNRLGRLLPESPGIQQFFCESETGDLIVRDQHGRYFYRYDLSRLSEPPLSYAEQSARLGYAVDQGKAEFRLDLLSPQ